MSVILIRLILTLKLISKLMMSQTEKQAITLLYISQEVEIRQ